MSPTEIAEQKQINDPSYIFAQILARHKQKPQTLKNEHKRGHLESFENNNAF